MWSLMPKIAGYILAIVSGALLLWIAQLQRSEIPLPANSIEQTIPLSLSTINQEDSWVNGFNLEIALLNNLQSNREYVLLIMKRKSDSSNIQLPDRISRFVLKGLADSESELWITINPSQMASSSSVTHTLLLDFRGSIFHKKRLSFTNKLELSSMDLSRYK